MGGAEKLLSEMIPRIKNHGYDVDVLVFDGSFTPLMKHLIDNGVHVLYLRQNHGYPYSILNLIKLIPIVRKYNIVHSHTTPAQLFCFIAKFFYPSLFLITTEHSTYNHRRGKMMFKMLDRMMYSSYAKIICIGKKPKENLEKQIGCLSDRSVIIENGIDIDLYNKTLPISRDKISCSVDDYILTMVGRFTDAKDQNTIIKALTYLPDKFKLILVGDGPLKELATMYAKNLGLKDRVVFLGLRSDVPSIIKASDVAILSSHWEGFGLAAVEGMASQKPVIATNVAGLREVVEGAGLLFKVGDAETLSHMVLRLYKDKDFYKDISLKCYERAQKYNIDNVALNYEKVYDEFINY